MSLEIADGEFVALLGPSGCGKTTLLRIIAGLETRSSGRVVIGGRDVSDLKPWERGLAMVFQNYAVFPHMTVYDNVAFGLAMQKRPKDVIDRQVRKAAALLHIEPYLERYPAKLSGGQRQRVAVARALAVEPAVLLMDEPLSNLDALLRLEMRAELKSVLREAGTTTVYVTHDQTEAMGLADRIAVMHGARIVQVAPPTEVYSRRRRPSSAASSAPADELRARAGQRRRRRARRPEPPRPTFRRVAHARLSRRGRGRRAARRGRALRRARRRADGLASPSHGVRGRRAGARRRAARLHRPRR